MWRLGISLVVAGQVALADAPRLRLPVDCTLGQDCQFQQFTDLDPGAGVRDFACQGASYDGHKGTDVRVSPAAYLAGARVLAPAAGVVIARRDGMVDRLAASAEDRAALAGKECGNGVVIDHGDGWESQLCHLARGSVSVRRGQTVDVGEVVGRIGLSGNTQFRHLHLSLRRHGRVVDPFVPQGSDTCLSEVQSGLWDDPAIAETAAQATRMLDAGPATTVPELHAVLAGDFLSDTPRNDAPLLVWGIGINLQKGDALRVIIDGPSGSIVQSPVEPVVKRKAQALRYGGRRAPSGGWPPGDYSWRVEILRGEKVMDRRTGQFTL